MPPIFTVTSATPESASATLKVTVRRPVCATGANSVPPTLVSAGARDSSRNRRLFATVME